MLSLARALLLCAAAVLALLSGRADGAKDPLDCEVCHAAIKSIRESAKASGAKDLVAIEAHVDKYCDKPPTEKEGKLVRARRARRARRAWRLVRARALYIIINFSFSSHSPPRARSATTSRPSSASCRRRLKTACPRRKFASG